MFRIESIFLLQRLKGSMSGDARDFNIETGAAIKFFFPARQGAEETSAEHAPSSATVNNRVAQFKRGDFSICDAPRPGRPKTVNNSEIIDQTHKLILEGRRSYFG
jgi:hypothetical protein